MLGLFFIYFIGKYFYELAEKYQKNKWVYALLGVLSYYMGAFITGFFLGLLMLIFNSNFLDSLSSLELNFLALPFGILTTFLFYIILRKNWSKNYITPEDEINLIGVQEEDQ